MTTSTSQISYHWEITGIGTITDSQLGLVVTDVYYAYSGHLQIQSDSPECWTQYFGGTVKIGDPNPQTYTEFSKLNKDQVIEWVKSEIGQTNIDSLTQDIQKSLQSQQHAYLANIQWHQLPWEV